MVIIMKVIRFIFFLFILCFSIYYLNNYIIKDNINIENLLKINKNKKLNNIFKLNNINSLLSIKTNINNSSNNSITKEEFIPTIYIYNTHQTEEYKETFYNIKPTVVTASNMIKEELETKNIYSIVEEKSIKKELNKRGLAYSNSYRISREFIEEVKQKYPSIIYFFDIHRDSVNKELSTVKIENKSYAKVMFIVAKKNDNYKENEKNVKIMEEYLNNNYKGILRNTYYQPLYAYNQDVNDKTFLIELGGPYNTLEEIYNTSLAISSAIEYLMEVNK